MNVPIFNPVFQGEAQSDLQMGDFSVHCVDLFASTAVQVGNGIVLNSTDFNMVSVGNDDRLGAAAFIAINDQSGNQGSYVNFGQQTSTNELWLAGAFFGISSHGGHSNFRIQHALDGIGALIALEASRQSNTKTQVDITDDLNVGGVTTLDSGAIFTNGLGGLNLDGDLSASSGSVTTDILGNLYATYLNATLILDPLGLEFADIFQRYLFDNAQVLSVDVGMHALQAGDSSLSVQFSDRQLYDITGSGIPMADWTNLFGTGLVCDQGLDVGVSTGNAAHVLVGGEVAVNGPILFDLNNVSGGCGSDGFGNFQIRTIQANDPGSSNTIAGPIALDNGGVVTDGAGNIFMGNAGILDMNFGGIIQNVGTLTMNGGIEVQSGIDTGSFNGIGATSSPNGNVLFIGSGAPTITPQAGCGVYIRDDSGGVALQSVYVWKLGAWVGVL